MEHHMKRLSPIAISCLLAFACIAYAQVRSSDPPRSSQHKTGQHELEQMSAAEMAEHMQMMNKMMVKGLGQADRQYDARFIDMMIPHHEGAVMMAKDALKKAQHQELKDLAEKMIKDQQKEIDQLKKWRQAWYGQTPSADEAN
jgi:uncharacterized protein (DUF305 family)